MSERTAKSFRVQIEGLDQLCSLRKLMGDSKFQEVVAGIGSQVTEKIRTLRNPTNGEFPLACAYPIADDALRLEIEATPQTQAFLAKRLPELGFNFKHDDEQERKEKKVKDEKEGKPVAFLAHSHEDHEFARRIATALFTKGVHTFFDEWELRSGDSIRRKLEAGIANCTHFIALLSLASIAKPWVNTEIDAGFVGMVGGKNRFIGLRLGIEVGALSPFLQSLWLPEIREATFDQDIEALVGDLYRVSRRPSLGPAPAYAEASIPDVSPAASALARFFVEKTERAVDLDPQTSIVELQPALGLAEDDLVDAIDELKGLGCVRTLPVLGPRRTWTTGPHKRLFTRFDRHWMQWDPAKDAILIAQHVQTGEGASAKIAEALGWPARRMNPALSYLLDRELVKASREISSQFVISWMHATEDTRRFLKALS